MRPALAAVAFVLLAALSLLLWNAFAGPALLPSGDRGGADAPVVQTGERTGGAAPPSTATPDAAATGSGRQLVGDAAPTTGGLLVRVTWAADGKPAADVLVELTRLRSDDLFESVQAATDADGLLRFADLAPGRFRVQLQRGGLGNDKEYARATVEAGKLAEAELVVGVGLDVRGIVVNGRNAPVGGAEVVVADWGGSRTVTLAHSAADGTFRLRAIGTHVHIGARSPGFAPSPLRQFTASAGAEVELRIVLDEAGAELAGVVLDRQDRPLADAVVQIGSRDQKNQKLPDGGTAMGPRPVRLRTGADGRFTAVGLPTGRVPLAARARDHSAWTGEVELAAGRRQDLTIHLDAGVTVFGTATDDAGKPVAGADVDLGDWDDLGYRSLLTGDDGTFRCAGLTAGPLRVHVEKDQVGKARKDLDAKPGETIRWDPVLTRGLAFRGRVLDDQGQPVTGAMVEGRPERYGKADQWWGFGHTDATGRFTFDNCAPDLQFTLTVRRKSTFPELVLEHQKPGPEEVVVQLPKAAWTHVRGTVLGPDGTVLAGVHVSPSMAGGSGSPAETTDAQGRFELGPYPPGQLWLSLQADGYPSLQLGPRQLAPDETWDLGELRFVRGGTLAVALVSDRAGPLPDLLLQIEGPQGRRRERLDVKDGRGRSGPLVPGEHVLQITGKGIASTRVPCVVTADAVTQLDVRLVSGVPVQCRLQLPAGLTARAGIACELRDADGTLVQSTSSWSTESSSQLEGCLRPGRYTLTATLADCRGEATFDVAAPGPVAVTVELQRR